MNANTSHVVRPNYALRRAIVATVFVLLVYFIGLPVYMFFANMFAYGMLIFHDFMLATGWMDVAIPEYLFFK